MRRPQASGTALDATRVPRRGDRAATGQRRPPTKGKRDRQGIAPASRAGDETPRFRLSAAERDDLARFLSPVEVFRASGSAPYPWQEKFIASRARLRLLVAPRQSGKSTCAATLAAHESVYRGGTALIVSVRQDQASYLLGRVRELARALAAPVAFVSDAQKMLVLANGGTVLSLPATEGGIRGYTPTLIIADEAARLPQSVFSALSPSLASSRGSFAAISTPFGRKGWFYDLWTSPETEWERHRVDLVDCPQYQDDVLSQLRRDLGERQFAEEMRGEFLDAEDDPKNPRLMRLTDDLLAAAFGDGE